MCQEQIPWSGGCLRVIFTVLTDHFFDRLRLFVYQIENMRIISNFEISSPNKIGID